MGRLGLMLILCGCAHPDVSAKASASIQGEAGEQAGAESGVSSGSTAGVTVRRGERHVGVRITPNADGGLPRVDLDVSDAPDEITAGAQGESDAGSGAAVDAGVGVAGQGDGSGAAKAPGFLKPWMIWVVVGLGGLAGALALAWKLKPPWTNWLWKLLRLA